MISKSITSFILFPIILCGCLTKGKEYTGDLKVTLPSKKELQFIDSLRSEGFTNVVLDIPIPTYTGKGNAFYCIDMKPPFLYDWTKKDSIRFIMKGIANKLYSQVIEDSIIIEFRSIVVTFHTNTLDKKRKDISYSYDKNQLEIYNGFKVVQDKFNLCKRLVWTKDNAQKVRENKKIEEELKFKEICERSESYRKAVGFKEKLK